MTVRSNIRGDVFPLVIDQADIEAPGFPRPQEWWGRFMPFWIAVDVQDDGTVTLDYNSWNPADLNDAKPGELTPAQLARGRFNMTRWVGLTWQRHLPEEAWQ